MQNRLTIYFRKKQLIKDNDPLQPVIVQCNPDGTASYIPGLVDQTWQEMTEYVEGLDKLKTTWTASTSDSTESDKTQNNELGSNYQKGLSADLSFIGPAFQFIYDWLMTDPCQILNCVEVRIFDNECNKAYRNFEIKTDNIEWFPEEQPCTVSIPLREQDEVIHAFEKTIIEDNWQGWFNKDGTSTKDHPTFSMIVEKKPKFYLAIYAALIYIAGILSIGLLTGFNEGKKWIRRTLGFCYFAPAPLIRTYIENICSKYGFTYDTIFDDLPGNPYRDLCLFWPASKTYKNFDDFDSPSTKFIWDNRSVYPFSKFLNSLKKVFNAEWYVTPNKQLVFKHKSFFDNQIPLYDFTAPGSDRIYNLKYSFNGTKKPAYGTYNYLVDPQDTCSNELKYRYNAIVDYDGPQNNPMLEGRVEKTFDFAMTSFHNDGSTEDFLEEGIKLGRTIAQIAVLLGLVQLLLETNPLTAAITGATLAVGYAITNGYVNNFFNNAELNGIVRVSSSEVNQPRLLLWDRATPMNKAKVVSVVNPSENARYNLTGNDYYQEHPVHDGPGGYFSLGGTVEKVYNYPMYVEENFTNNLFDRFHEYDNPLANPKINQSWEGSVDLCCEWLDRLGVWENLYAKIGSVLILENRNGRTIKGKLEYFEPDYDSGTITLKGTVIK